MNQTNLVLQFAFNLLFDDEDDNEKRVYNNAKIHNYAESIVPNYTQQQFQRHFRITPTTFEELLTKLTNLEVINWKSTGGNPELPLEKQLLITLWYMANIESYRGVADRFGVSTSTTWQCVFKCCNKLLELNRVWGVIKFSSRPEEYRGTIEGFNRRTGFPNVIGAIDGSHIPIKAPHNNPVSYINRKGYHSMLLQGICDNKRRFLDCYVGEVGSVHDACMYRRSEISARLENNEVREDLHLLGDSAYPLKMTLMTPFKNNGHLTPVQIHYNKKHSKCRSVIENAFALLKGRFRRLKLMEAVRPDMIPLMILSACILHNICLNTNDVPGDINVIAEVNEERLMHPNELELGYRNINARANIKRNNIANLLFVHNEN